ncbi:hypothetical protein ZEAMMB73_Zm00001d051175 [Zea mays]|uniref:Uncharacterized protein n=1 Tax=Zea mays TaxID=4577 RepID=A0A1D6Q5C5_MAIZE|nr:hypothetical protein ZEAMMB73_Zm00001d051175 [Zea mays]
MRCSLAAVNNTALTLSDRVTERLKDLGFGLLPIMNIEVLEDRVLGAYLLSSVHDNPLCIEVGGRSLPITAQVVHLVTGLPMGNQKFPELGYHEMTSAKSRFSFFDDDHEWSKYFIAVTQFRDVENIVYSASRGLGVVDTRASHHVVVFVARGGSTSSIRGTHGRLRQKAAANRGSRPPTASDGRQPTGSADTGRATNSERGILYGVNSLESSLAGFASSLHDESSREAFRKALIEHDNSIRVALTNIEVIEKQIADSHVKLKKNKESIVNPTTSTVRLLRPYKRQRVRLGGGETLHPPVEVQVAPSDRPVTTVDDVTVEQVAHQAIDLAQTPQPTAEEEAAPSHQLTTEEEDAPSHQLETVGEPILAEEVLDLAASVESQEDTGTPDAPSAGAYTPHLEGGQTDADEP